ncbi:hypothetical protein [Larkinella soli]|uniref:hypothetical protein n=1 Tax=Larkinella soli TaxID=1770527 RepID=UPI001E5CF5D2|nr:hypothetical protein [Larkinella soli]
MPRFGKTLSEGQQMADEIEAGLKLIPIGMLPLYRNEGYLFLHWTDHAQTHIYYFCLKWSGLPSFRPNPAADPVGDPSVRTQYIDSVRKGIGRTFEALKLDLIRRRPHLPNPATFMVESRRRLPLEHTLLPLAGRLVERQATA